MEVTYFRPRKTGPETSIEDAVASHFPRLFLANQPTWAAGSLPIGAGRPDLLFVAYDPQVLVLDQVDMPTVEILAYLRAVGRARIDRISGTCGQRCDAVLRSVSGLLDIEALSGSVDAFLLSPRWKQILPEIVAVEAKVANWRKAVDQAARNRIFAHRSFVALPERVATRVRKDREFTRSGVGLLSVGTDSDVRMVRSARRAKPRVWSYYYRLAFILAKHIRETKHAVPRSEAVHEALPFQRPEPVRAPRT